jgi:hypothetical protein
MDAAEIFEPPAEGRPGTATADAHRSQVLAALQGAARRGWLGPLPGTERESATVDASDRTLEIDLLALSIKAAVDRMALPLTETARALLEARVWTTFGYARLEDYARERHGRTGRWLRDQASLGRSLESHPSLADALCGADGGRPLGKVSALWVGKVASADSVGAWIDLARAVSVRELKEMVRQALRADSDTPPSADGPGAERAVAENDASDDEHGDVDEFCRLRMALPIAMRAAFDQTLRLHRAVSGREASVISFVEALVAEARAGLRPPDVESVGFVPHRGAEAALERELAVRTALWSRLRDRCAPGTESALAAEALVRLEELSHRAGRGDGAELDRQIRALLRLEDELERRLGVLLRELNDRRAWSRLRFAGLGHYAEQRLGLGRTAVEGRVRLARAVRRCPGLKQAYEQGRVGPEAALLVVRILGASGPDSGTERAWVERAEEATVKRLRDELRALELEQASGAGPRELRPLPDAAWHGSLMQRPGEIRARVHELGRRAVVCGTSDVFLRLTLPEEQARDFLAAVESSRQALGAETVASSAACETEGEVAASLHAARMFSARGRAVPSWVGLLAMLEDFVDTWDLSEASPDRRADEVYAREGWRCFAPGCTSRRNLEDHHLEYRSRGGDARGLSNRICLCAFHHRRGEHGDLARCRGQAPLGVLWRLGRREVGVWFRNERRLNSNRTTREAQQESAA